MCSATMLPEAATGRTLPGQIEGSVANSYRVAITAKKLAAQVVQPRLNVSDFFNLCLSLARGIDYAVANNEVPEKAQLLPLLAKQVCQRKSDTVLQAAIMVLMFSIKSACKVGWFSVEEAQELLALANEVGSSYLSPGDINTRPSHIVSTVSTIMTRFYPLMKMGQILTSLEVEPGYGAYVVDFHISKNTTHSSQEKIRLLVAQTDIIETSACIISPQQVNFLINGRGVERRTNVFMDTGPLLPTNVSPMLKYGTNLLQAIGQFNGRCVIVVAFMSMASSLNSPVLQDYVHSGNTMQDSDSELIEGPSRISLNCPISYTRIKTPVKGHSCKHHQCFDLSNFIDINSRRPSWRCPHCNQHVCYTDIRVDQNMVKVLKEVGENIAVVIISADGSWKAIMESDDNEDKTCNKILPCEKEGFEKQQSTGITSYDHLVLDLTNDDDEMDAVSTVEIEDRKPNLQSQPVTTNLTGPSEFNNMVMVNQNAVSTEDDFWTSILYPNRSASSGAWSDTQTVGGISQPTSANFMVSPVLTDAISPALNREVEALGFTNLTNSIMPGPYTAADNLQLQQTQFCSPISNHEYGRSSVMRHANRTPIAVQALPALSQTSTPQQRSGTNLNFLTPDGSSLPSNDFSDAEWQQLFSRSHMNTFLGPDMPSSSLLHHHSASQVGLQTPPAYRASSGLSTENQILHQRQALNLRMPPPRSLSPSMIQTSSPLSRTPTQQGSAQVGPGHTAGNGSNQQSRFMATPRAVRPTTQMTRQPPTVPVQVQVQTSNTSPRFPMTVDGIRAPLEDQRVNIGGLMQPGRADNLTDLPSEQSRQPTGRMRGSLTGRAYDTYGHLIIRPTESAQPARPQTNQASPLSRLPPRLQVLLGNRTSSAAPQSQTNPTTGPATVNGGSSVLPERSLGTH